MDPHTKRTRPDGTTVRRFYGNQHLRIGHSGQTCIVLTFRKWFWIMVNIQKRSSVIVTMKKTFQNLHMLYEGITSGSEDDADDELNYLLNKPFEMAMVYEGTEIGDGEESFIIIEETERVLESNGIILPDVNAVSFSNSSERNGWGNYFDGRFLSVILK